MFFLRTFPSFHLNKNKSFFPTCRNSLVYLSFRFCCRLFGFNVAFNHFFSFIYHDGVCLRQGVQWSLLLHWRIMPYTTPSHIILTLISLSLRWAHMSFCWFCHEVAQMSAWPLKFGKTDDFHLVAWNCKMIGSFIGLPFQSRTLISECFISHFKLRRKITKK